MKVIHLDNLERVKEIGVVAWLAEKRAMSKRKGLTLKQILKELILMQYEVLRVFIHGDKD